MPAMHSYSAGVAKNERNAAPVGFKLNKVTLCSYLYYLIRDKIGPKEPLPLYNILKSKYSMTELIL